jgi:hypothetical protein
VRRWAEDDLTIEEVVVMAHVIEIKDGALECIDYLLIQDMPVAMTRRAFSDWRDYEEVIVPPPSRIIH